MASTWLMQLEKITSNLVVDGKEGKKYDNILVGHSIFSPDSKHVAYAGVKDRDSLIVVDGKKVKKHNGIGDILSLVLMATTLS